MVQHSEFKFNQCTITILISTAKLVANNGATSCSDFIKSGQKGRKHIKENGDEETSADKNDKGNNELLPHILLYMRKFQQF